MGEPLDESAVEVGKAQERLYFLPVRWNRPFRYSSYLDWVHLNGILGNNHSEVLHFCLFELALLGFEEEVVFPEQFHNSPSDPPVLLESFREYQDVVQVHHRTSSLVKYLAPLSLLMSSEMRGSGYLFLTVITFRAQ